MDEKNHDPNNWQAIVEQAMNAEAKEARQTLSLIRESDACCPHSHRLLYNKEKD